MIYGRPYRLIGIDITVAPTTSTQVSARQFQGASMKKALGVMGIVIASVSAGAHPQTQTKTTTPTKTAIHLACTPSDDSNDSTGARFCSALRDLIAASPRYVETNDSSNEAVQYVIIVTTVSLTTGTTVRGAAASVVLCAQYKRVKDYMDSWIFAMPKSDPDSTAKDVFADIDNQVSK